MSTLESRKNVLLNRDIHVSLSVKVFFLGGIHMLPE